jgi:hypothetical protein
MTAVLTAVMRRISIAIELSRLSRGTVWRILGLNEAIGTCLHCSNELRHEFCREVLGLLLRSLRHDVYRPSLLNHVQISCVILYEAAMLLLRLYLHRLLNGLL